MSDAESEIRAFEPASRRVLRGLWRLAHGPPNRGGYWLTREFILRGLGVVYLAAFATAIDQLVPLVGSRGLTPVGPWLQQIQAQAGGTTAAFFELPTIFWLDHSDPMLLAMCWLGAALSLAVVLGLSNAVVMFVLWAIYLSIDHVGQRWYGFGWEIQLLETGLLAVFLVPVRGLRPLNRRAPVPKVVVWLLRWLIVRIMLGAGLIKLRGDPCWHDLTCLYYHFETQPIPHPGSWLAHQAPAWMLRGGVAVNHFVELVAPLFAFGPRRARHLAATAMIGFQVALILSGNLSFLNWLTIVPCLACYDDGALRRILPRRLAQRFEQAGFDPDATPRRPTRWTSYVLAAVVAYRSLDVVSNLMGVRGQAMNRSFDPLHLVNTYGAFGVVGRERRELVIEGTADPDPTHATWQAYEFECKPGAVDRRPCLITPFHERLDWLMWFAALEAQRLDGLDREAWVIHLLYKLLIGESQTLSLLGHNPFPDQPPSWVRVVMYRYRFTRFGDGSDAWWSRQRVGEFVQPLHRHDPRLLAALRTRGWSILPP